MKKALILIVSQFCLLSCIKQSYYYSSNSDELVGKLKIPINITQTYNSDTVDYIMINKYVTGDSFLNEVVVEDGLTKKKFVRSYRDDIDYYYFKIPKSHPKKINIMFKFISNSSSENMELTNLKLKKKQWFSTSFH